MTGPTTDAARGARRWPWIVAGLVAAVLAGLIVLRFVYRDSATPVPVSQAVQDFREGSTTEPDDPPDTTTPVPSRESSSSTAPADVGPGRPELGVYVYDTAGFEEIDALDGTRHEYPAITTITVREGECGTVHRWDALEERFEEWETCLADDGLAIPWYTAFHRFFGNDDRQDFVCEIEPLLITPDPAPGTSRTGVCRSADLVETITVTFEGAEQLTVAGTPVDTLRLAQSIVIEGNSTGAFASMMWLARDTGLVIRWSESGESTTGSLIGDVNYAEEFSVSLTGLTPRR